ncbi:MAG TPA: nucleoside 2-deoxyribosyltransferase [bacterium]|mgnify:CR=1 FL=1|nr:nucleoside 2-deoxyribosyltransferase [bacterium]HQG46495.1 nucleoside 2-deoxyribosyltransferase [bacterium]HQI47589.1 nucleoside 2-deoxyribosyltransferase [bacterium]HQJ64367.1 nucleoside 2-deoxyribosyltransferase [bacterium]HQJ65479.1 nucleoside 2-deoxyribosyltransferase [bacterium]
MQIYFAASIAGGRSYLPTYRRMVDFLKAGGHRVLTEHIVAQDVLRQEQPFSARQIFERDAAWLESCDCVVAEISNPSLGVGYEICYALDCSKPLLCLHARGLFISRMITGISRPGFSVADYGAEEEWQQRITAFLGAVSR